MKITAFVCALLLWCSSALAMSSAWGSKLGTFNNGRLENQATEPAPAKNPWAGKLGTFDAQHRLQNPTAPALRFALRSFGAYFFDSGDFNLGFSFVPYWNPRRRWDLSLDMAPHRVGAAVNWLRIPFLGLGVGAQILYNTNTDRFEPGFKIQIKKW